MVLTDVDYGKAYVSDGWASRFLVKMLSTYTVLFVGYGFNDAPMRYLVRSISSEVRGRVFVLEKEGSRLADWERNGITPLLYKSYDDLPEFFAEWDRRNRLTVYERSSRISEIASLELPVSFDDANTVKEAITDANPRNQEAFTRAFTQSARSFEAIKLLAVVGLDSFLYEDASSARDWLLQDWAAQRFAISHYRELTSMGGSQRRKLSSSFKWNILSELARQDAGDDCLAWWSLFIEPADIAGDFTATLHVAKILEKCHDPNVALSYIAKLFALQPTSQMPLLGEGAQKLAPAFVVDVEHFTAEIRDAILKHADSLGFKLFDFCVSQLEETRAIETCLSLDPDAFDPECYNRSAIEPHEQDGRANGPIHLLIDVARETGEALMGDAENAALIVARCIDSDANLPKRLGIHLMRLSECISADEAIGYVIARHWLTDFYLKHEVFLLLAETYQRASSEAKRHLALEVSEAFPDIEDRHMAYRRFNVLSWLLQHCPSDEIALAELDKVMALHPSFQQTEHPDLSHFAVSSWDGVERECEIDESDFTAHVLRERFLADPEPGMFAESWEKVAIPMRQHPRKAIAVAFDLLEDGSDVSLEMAGIALHSIEWRDAVEGHEQAAIELLLRALALQPTYADALFATLQIAHLEQSFLGEHQDDCQAIMEAMAAGWEWALAENPDADGSEERDWVFTFLNCTCGQVLGFFLFCMRRFVLNEADESAFDMAGFLGMVEAAILAGGWHGNALVAGCMVEVGTLIESVPQFVRDVLMPRLQRADRRRHAAWQGISFLGGVPQQIWDLAKEPWIELVSHPAAFEGGRVGRLASMFVWATIVYEDSSERYRLVVACGQSSPAVRKAALQRLSDWVGQLSDEDLRQEWYSWLKRAVMTLLQQDDAAAEITCLLIKWLPIAGDLTDELAGIIAEFGKLNGGRITLTEEIASTLLRNPHIADDNRIAILCMILNSECHIVDEALSAIKTLDVTHFSKAQAEELKDALTLRSIDVSGMSNGLQLIDGDL